ncbi:MAG TPA: hypothetical protein VMF09_04065 [Solirubrobacteraceae bacterium]|nr:hypothetical protein [Solirubrobacteraceae bacterium]
MGLLFCERDLASYLHSYDVALHDEVQHTPDDELLQADVEAWSAALGAAYAVHSPQIRADEWWAEPPETGQVDVRHDSSRVIRDPSRPALVPGTRVRIHVPFDGDGEVFGKMASTRSWNPPVAEVEANELIFDLSWPDDRPMDPGGYVKDQLAKIEDLLKWSRQDCEAHNGGLSGYARGQIERRVASIKASRASLQASGIPVRSGKPRISDALVRRPAPRRQAPRAGEPHVPLEPSLSEDVYEHVLEVIRLQGDAMQRAPGAYAGMNEEALRQVLLSALNTHYAGQVSAEAFNGAGKTDLLVRDGDRAVFIAECKRWTGVKALGEALDQLLGYSTWHDSKLALVVFVDRADLGGVVKSASR